MKKTYLNQKIIKLLDKGLKPSAIALKLRCSTARVYQIIQYVNNNRTNDSRTIPNVN